MKRKRCDTVPESSNPSPIPTSIHRVRIPVTRPDSRSIQADGPKTSEYAFFKKLKTDAGQRFGTHLKQREKNLSNKVNHRECGRVLESTNIVRNCSKEFSSPLSVGDVSSKRLESLLSIRNASCEVSRSPLPINNVMHCNFDSFVSPVDRADNNPEINLKKAVSALEETCSIEDYLEQDKTNRQEGSQSGKVELFSRKRQKLYQWAYRSFPEMDNSKGYDLIPVLLNRLLPWGNEEKCFQSKEPLQVENNSKTELLTRSKSDVPSNKPYRMPLKNIMDVDYVPTVENSTSSYWSGRSRETMLSNCCYPTYTNHGSLENNLELPSCKISCTEENSAFGFPFVRHGSFSPFKEPDEYYDLLQLNRIPSNLELPRCELRGKSLISCDEENSAFGFPFVRHGSFPPFSHFKEPDEYYDLLQLKRIPSNLELPRCKLRGKSLMSYDEENYAFGFPFVRHGSFLPFSPFKEPEEYYDLLQLKRIPSNLELPNCKLRRESLISCDEENCAFGFPFVRHGSFLPFDPFKEPDKYYDPNRCLLGTEPRLLLLDCDSVNVNERSLSVTSQNTNWAIIPVQNSWDHQQSLDNCCESFATVGLCPLPIMENYPQKFYTLKPSNGSVYDKHEFGRIPLEEEIVADSKHLPFTSLQSPEAFNLIAGSNYYGVAYKDSETNYILRSPVNHLVFLDEAFGEENSASFTEPHLSFALDAESKYLRPSGLRRYPCSSTCNDLHFHEKEMMHSNFLGEDEFGSSSGGLSCRRLICFSDDIAKIHDSESFYLRIYQDKDKVYPFLDDDSIWEGCTEEAYACGNEGKSL